jgi:hypothetical protein
MLSPFLTITMDIWALSTLQVVSSETNNCTAGSLTDLTFLQALVGLATYRYIKELAYIFPMTRYTQIQNVYYSVSHTNLP